MRWAILILVILAAACSSSAKTASSSSTTKPSAPKTTSAPATSSPSHPAGIDSSVWDDYCVHGSSLISTLQDAEKGVNTTAETVSRLTGAQNGIAGDATAAKEPLRSQMQAVADAIGRVKVAISNGDTPDYSEVVTAVQALPSCA